MFKSIDELEQRLYCCAGCEKPLSLVIFNLGKKNWYPDSNLKELENTPTDESETTYTSVRDGDFISFCYTMNHSRINSIFVVNTITGKIEGNLEYIQNVLWNNHLRILRHCNNKNCDSRYISETSRLFLEKKNIKIYQLSLNLEGYVHKQENMSYTLFNTSEDARFLNTTTLMSFKPDVVIYDKAEVVARLPKIDFSTIKSGIDKKIKTIITFL